MQSPLTQVCIGGHMRSVSRSALKLLRPACDTAALRKLVFGREAGNLSVMLSQEEIQNALKAVKYPGYSRDIISFGLVKEISAANGAVSVTMQLTSPNPEAARQIKEESERVLKALPGVNHVHVEVRQPAAGQAPATNNPFANQTKVSGVKRVIAVASGKGGVGKSTCSVNLACALTHLGAKVGLLDCDIYGPSIPLMMGVHERPTVNEAERLVPPSSHGVKVMSIGLLVTDDQPVVWRGPMITKTIQQFLLAVEWGDLDFLLVDLPPGTGDAQLSLCQTVPLDGGVIVTTPQEASLGVVRKGIAMFNKVNTSPRRTASAWKFSVTAAARPKPRGKKFRFSAKSRSSPKSAKAATGECRLWFPRQTMLRERCLSTLLAFCASSGIKTCKDTGCLV